MKNGTLVVWITPQDESEKTEIMTVLEDRQERLLVCSSITAHFPIRPCKNILKSDIKILEAK